MKFPKFILFILILPLTLFLDLILFALTRSCPTCGSFGQWITSEGALSFPLVSETLGYVTRVYNSHAGKN